MRARGSRWLAAILIATAAGVLLGCASIHRQVHAASQAPLGQNTAALPGKPACFRIADFGGSWLVLNDSELVVPDPVFSRWYLFKLSEPVFGLKFKLRYHLTFEPFPPDDELVCSSSSSSTDYLRVPHWRLHSVPIQAVRELTVAERRRLLLQNHIEPAAGPRSQRDPGPSTAQHGAL
jgi:Family of unknown function (DUF6491)